METHLPPTVCTAQLQNLHIKFQRRTTSSSSSSSSLYSLTGSSSDHSFSDCCCNQPMMKKGTRIPVCTRHNNNLKTLRARRIEKITNGVVFMQC
jgi:hypothetical protein